ncbi:MAG: DUF1549 and DUF1553 domain-containing protein [Planctomycetia bacterium]|nr:DUF1549 and DUF1553 domain-containing protein [Planctomycetia bacterium]
MKSYLKYPWLLIAIVTASVAFLLTANSLAAAEQKPRSQAQLPTEDLPPGRTDDASKVIDDYFTADWAKAKIVPAPVIDDATFLRRASLSVLGVSADADEVRSFLVDTRSEKRRGKVDEMLRRSRYADYWGFRLRDWILSLREVEGQGANSFMLYRYSREAMAENRSWTRIAGDFINSQGTLEFDGNANFGVYFSGAPNEMADATTRLFLGTKISCAQCHDDPFHSSLTQQGYWGLAAFFGRTKMIQMNGGGAEYERLFPNPGRSEASVCSLPGGDAAVDGYGGERRAIVDVKEGEVYIGGRKPKNKDDQPLAPLPLGGEPIKDADQQTLTRRQQLLAWVTNRDNPYFSRAAVNRMFLELTGRGFVPTADGFTPDDSPRHEQLLNQLSQQFTEHDYDLKWLIRTIVNSRVFQLESSSQLEPDETKQAQRVAHWCSAETRTLNGDQWHDSVLRASGREARIWTLADKASPELKREQNRRLASRRTRLITARKILTETDKLQRLAALPTPDTVPPPIPREYQHFEWRQTDAARQAYDELGQRLQKTRGQARSPLGPTGEALMQMNGALVRDSLRETDVPKSIAALKSPGERLDAVFVQVLGRAPRPNERQSLADSVATGEPERVADLMWALMQTSEFLSY